MRIILRSLAIGLVSFHVTVGAHSSKSDCESALTNQIYTLKRNSDGEKTFAGLTPAGFKRVEAAMQAIQHNVNVGNQVFEGNETLLKLYLTTLAGGFNMLASGGPGGGKSAVPNWLFGNHQGFWGYQLDDASRRMDIIGGQTQKDFEEGRSFINTSGTLVDAEIGLIDEINNASPAVLSSLLSLVNPKERFVTVGGKKVRAEKLRGVFMTGNATLFEMLENFKALGMQSGPAFLNRVTIKAQIGNWLTLSQQERRDAWIRKRNALLVDKKFAADDADRKEAVEALQGIESQKVDFDAVEAFAERAFEATDDLEYAARDFANEMWLRFRNEKLSSEKLSKENPQVYPSVFTPSSDWTERFREDVIKLIKMSVAVDYLAAMDPRDLQIQEPIKLSRMSLWRAFAMSVQVPGGLTRFNPRALADQHASENLVQFGLIRQDDGKFVALDPETIINNSESTREATAMKDMMTEHRIFNEALKTTLLKIQKTIKNIAVLTQEDPAKAMTASGEIEFVLLKKGQ